MINLQNTMDQQEFEKFTEKGFFTVRRSDNFFCSTSTDMIIEQEFNKNLKHSKSGMTHGRGTDDAPLSRRIITMPYMIDLIKLVEIFCGVNYVTSEQHKDASDSRIQHDKKDIETFFFF